jgi:hypothetical protein
MPYKSVYIKPKVAVKCNGVTVFCTYKDDDWDQGPCSYWFTLNENDYSEDETAFDVRDLPNYKDKRPPSWSEVDTPENSIAWDVYSANESRMIKKVLRDAIKMEFLYKDEDGNTVVKKLIK